MKKFWLLLLILLVAGFLRFWRLGQVPPSPDWDEASLGYNAYSLLKTGRDEYGANWPFFIRSFGDYKPAAYAYLIIPFIPLFGLTTLAVRLPAALFGALMVLLTYYLINELFALPFHPRGEHSSTSGVKLNQPVNSLINNKSIALIAAFLLAISPWHLQFSRVAFESNLGVLLNVLVALFFLKGLKKPFWLPLASLLAGANLYVYQAEKVFAPLFFLWLVFLWRKKFFKIPPRWLLITIASGLIAVLPFINAAFTNPEIFFRAKDTSFAADQTRFLARTVSKLERDRQANDVLGLIIDNRRWVYLKTFAMSYLSHFDLDWLFIRGDDTRHHAPGMGLLYLVELPFFFWGIYYLIFARNIHRTIKGLIFGWFLLAPLPAAFTEDTPHAVRALRMIPIVQLFGATGFWVAWQWLQEKRYFWQIVFVAAFGCLATFNFSYFLSQYFVQQNYFTSQQWQYGYQQAVAKVETIKNQYDRIIVSSELPLDQSYIFFLFFTRYDPKNYLAEGGTSRRPMEEGNSFDKYFFRPIKWGQEAGGSRVLYVGRPGKDFPMEVVPLQVINFVDGQPAILIVEG